VTCWLGINVGGERKGFDAALIDEYGVLGMQRRLPAAAVLELVSVAGPTLVGIDGPCCWAPDGETSRAGERLLNRAVCGIRWTPDQHQGLRSDYYAWIREGLALFDALRSANVKPSTCSRRRRGHGGTGRAALSGGQRGADLRPHRQALRVFRCAQIKTSVTRSRLR
jgi:hypothetical protein